MGNESRKEQRVGRHVKFFLGFHRIFCTSFHRNVKLACGSIPCIHFLGAADLFNFQLILKTCV